MSLGRLPLPPTSSLPRLRSPETLTSEKIIGALQALQDLYCPLPRRPAFASHRLTPGSLLTLSSTISSGTTTPLVTDSGYASGNEDDDDQSDGRCQADMTEALSALRADVFERQFAIRWLTTLIARAEELVLLADGARQRAVDDASYILASFCGVPEEGAGGADSITRELSFPLRDTKDERARIQVCVNDMDIGFGSDHTDVGLQSWGASVVVSGMMCSDPEHFGLTRSELGDEPRIVELGAGTGLVGITLAKLLPLLGVKRPTVIATDYHAAVLANLRDNAAANFADGGIRVQITALDWSAPRLEAPLDKPADVLVATDVIYAPEHAAWLRDVAGRLLAPTGVFWLVASVRPNGRHAEVMGSVERAFADMSKSPKTTDGRLIYCLH